MYWSFRRLIVETLGIGMTPTNTFLRAKFGLILDTVDSYLRNGPVHSFVSRPGAFPNRWETFMRTSTVDDSFFKDRHSHLI